MVKLAGTIALLGPAARVVHTGQHYDDSLSAVFFRELGIPEPDAHLGVGGSTRGAQIGRATELLDEELSDRPTAAVVVQGDTNSTVAGAIAANARELPLVHIEAGLRSHDRAMPEEHNRVIADHLADLCCAPTEVNRANLAAEGIDGNHVLVTGNTVVEALLRLLPEPADRAAAVAASGMEPGRYVLSTMHRPENVDERATLATILEELAALPLPVLLPLHPRTAGRIEQFGLGGLAAKLVMTEPQPYRHFLSLMAESALVVSDSGGLAEEVSVLKRPLVVVRRTTERPEVMGTFAERVRPGPGIRASAARFLDDPDEVAARLAGIPSPYGDGSASRRSVDGLLGLLEAA